MRCLLPIWFSLLVIPCLAQKNEGKRLTLDEALAKRPEFGKVVTFFDKKIFIIERYCLSDSCGGAVDSAYYCLSGWWGYEDDNGVVVTSELEKLTCVLDEESKKWNSLIRRDGPSVSIKKRISENPLRYEIEFHAGSRTYPMEMTLANDRHFIISGLEPYGRRGTEITTYKFIMAPEEVFDSMSMMFR